MKLGIIGLPLSGKTTVFNALTGQHLPTSDHAATGKLEVSIAVVDVPDPRVGDLAARYRPKKTTYATVTFTDIGGIEEGIGTTGIHGALRNELAKVDGFAQWCAPSTWRTRRTPPARSIPTAIVRRSIPSWSCSTS